MDTVYALFQEIVEAHKEELAILENNRTMTFGELSDLVDRIACSFPQEIHSVGIVMRHRPEMIASILAVLKCGGQYVPAEPDFPTGRIHDMMKETEVDFVLTEHAFAPKLEGFPIRYTDCEICGVETPSWKRNAVADPERPAYVLYTSGTTGRPKGVCVRNRNVCHYVRAFAKEFHPGPGDIMLQYSVCSFDIFVEEAFTSLLNGAALAIPSEEDKADIHTLMAFVERRHVTMLSGFPYLLADMNHLASIPSSLRLLISGGDVLRGVYVDHLLDKAEVYNTYGPSETTVCASYYRCNDGTVLEDGTYPIGHPVLGAQIRILDPDGHEVPKGQAGEICIYGGGVSMGYIGDHAEENKALLCFPPLNRKLPPCYVVFTVGISRLCVPQLSHPVFDCLLRRGRLFLITIENCIGNHRFRHSLCDNIHTAGQSAGSMGTEQIYLLPGKIVFFQKRKQRHGHAIPPVGVAQKNRIILIQILHSFLQCGPRIVPTFLIGSFQAVIPITGIGLSHPDRKQISTCFLLHPPCQLLYISRNQHAG